MKSIVILILSTVCYAATAQQSYFYINLDINKPLSNTSWMKSTSSRGGNLGYRAFIADGKFGAGIDLGWSYFDQYEPTRTFEQPGRAITTDYFKYIYSYSVAFTGQYYPLAESGHKIFYPYVGIGIGGRNNEYVIYYNIYDESDRSWGFLVRPEAGVFASFGEDRSFGAKAAFHVDYSTNKSSNYGYSNFTTFGFQLGFVLITF